MDGGAAGSDHGSNVDADDVSDVQSEHGSHNIGTPVQTPVGTPVGTPVHDIGSGIGPGAYDRGSAVGPHIGTPVLPPDIDIVIPPRGPVVVDEEAGRIDGQVLPDPFGQSISTSVRGDVGSDQVSSRFDDVVLGSDEGDEGDGSADQRGRSAGGSRTKAERSRTTDPRFTPEVRLANEAAAFARYGLRNTSARIARRERLQREEKKAREQKPKNDDQQ